MKTQKRLNMNIGNYTKTLCDELRKSLLITLTLLFVCPGVWGDTFPAAVNGVKTLADNATYYLINDTHFNDGYLYIPSGCTVTIQFSSNQTLSRSLPSTTENGYVIKNEGTLNIIGNGNYPWLSGGKNTGNGGCIYNSGILNVNGISFLNNQTEGNGGAVYNTSSGVVTLTNCRMGYSYWYNTAVNGAGVYNEGVLIIDGGQFNGNIASGQGGAIYQAGGTLTIKNSPVIANNKVDDVTNNVYLTTGKTIAIDDELGSGANIGITVQKRGKFTSGSTSSANYNKFFSDITGINIVNDESDNNAVILTDWDILQAGLTSAAASSGTYQLTQNFAAIQDIDEPLVFTGTATIDLNGHTIDRGLSSSSPTTNGHLVSIASGCSLTINDTGGGGIITGGKVSGNGGAIINAGTLTVSGGTITGNSATGNGGAIFNTGTATISGGTLSSNSASQGGAIYNNGTLTVSSGAIQNNTASTNGGGIYHYDGTLNMSGAPTISGNQKGTADNNVYLASGKTITVNADLTNTTPIGITMANIGVFTTGLESHAGDYTKFVSDDARFVTANSSGNAKLQTYWMDLQEQLTAGDVTLTRNYEYLSGFDNAGLTVSTDKTLNLGSYKIDRKLSTATENGYVIKVTGGTLTVTGTGQITGGNNSGNGGGIFVDGGTLILSGGNITGNTAALGGGVYNGGTLQMSGAPIVTGNTGGNVYLPDGHTTITLLGTMNGSDGNIGITMQTPGVFTSGMNTYGTISKFASDNGDYEVAPNGDEATLLSHWAALKATLAKGGTVNLTRDYVAPSAGDGYLEVPNTKTVALDLKGHTINRHLTEATADGYVIKVAAGGTLTISDSGTGGAITGGNNSSDADGQRGGGICNLGTVNLQGGIIRGNQSVKGGGIYNENTLNISGGTIESNTATTGGGIYNNGATFTMNGAPNISENTGGNTYLPAAHPTITISAVLNNTTAIGITMETNGIFTSGLSGNGNSTNFASDNSSYGIGLNSSNEAVIGNKRTIRRDEPNNTYTYMYIKGNYTSNTIEAIAGERVKVTISGDGTYKTIPVSLSYTDGTLSTYPKGGVEYGFDMPDHDVTVMGLCLKGGYCGNANDEDIKYYLDLDGTTLRFQAKDASNYQMKNYDQNTVPWRDTSTYPYTTYTSVDIPNNITHISDYAFYGSGLTTADIPASIATIGTFAFGNCTSLTAINVNAGNANFMNNSGDGVLYTKSAGGDPTNLVCYPAGKDDESYSVPSTVTAITDGAFAFNTHLTTINVESGGIPSFSATNGVLYNAGGTELYCYPARKTGDIYDVASTVTEIKPYAFHNNNLLKVVNFCEASVPTGGKEMFENHNSQLRIMVKKDQGANYKAAANWINYKDIIFEMDMANAVASLEYTTHKCTEASLYPGLNGSVTITVEGQTLTLRKDIDYTIEKNSDYYTNNTAVGTATVTIKGAGGYAGTNKALTFTITRELIISGADNRYTYYASEDLTLPSHLTAWTYTAINWETGVMTATQIHYIPANVPVILHRSGASINETLYLTAHAGGTHANPIQYYRGTATAKDIDVLKTEINTELHTAEYIYVLRGENFVRATSGTLPAKHCYLYKPSGTAAPSVLTTTFSTISGGSYKIETLNASNGTVNIQYDNSGTPTNDTVNTTEIPAGKTVTLTITPDDGYYLSALQCEEVTTLDVAMAPAHRADKTQEIHKININNNYEGHFAGNYTFPMPRNNVIITATFVACTSISSFDLTLDGDNVTKTYNRSPHTVTLKNGETTLVKGTEYGITTGNETYTNVSSNEVTLTGWGRYNGTRSATLSITAKTLNVTADAKSKTYADPDPTLTYTTTGLESGDENVITGALSRNSGKNVGTYTINQNTLSAGSNYSISYTSANLTINQRDISNTAVITLNSVFMNYDGSTPFTPGISSITDPSSNDPLVLNTDYNAPTYPTPGVYSQTDHIQPDIYTISVSFKGNYTGTTTKEYQVRPKITMSGNNVWYTYYNPTYNMKMPDEVKAYTISGNTQTQISLSPNNDSGHGYIKAATPMLLYYTGASTDIYPELVKTDDSHLSTISSYTHYHGLSDATVVTSLPEYNTKDIWILVNNQFVRTDNGSIPANRCYLALVKNSITVPHFAPAINFGGLTDIDEPRDKKENVELKIYNLNGQRVQNPTKGLYIVNGKKVIIK